MESANPCITCGGCCAYFRVVISPDETSDVRDDGVPVELTEALADGRRVMRTVSRENLRCVALERSEDGQVKCGIYDRRPSRCRAFMPSFYDGVVHKSCDRVRRFFGFWPLTDVSWCKE